MVEQLAVNQRVAGSSPASGANFSPNKTANRTTPLSNQNLGKRPFPTRNHYGLFALGFVIVRRHFQKKRQAATSDL